MNPTCIRFILQSLLWDIARNTSTIKFLLKEPHDTWAVFLWPLQRLLAWDRLWRGRTFGRHQGGERIICFNTRVVTLMTINCKTNCSSKRVKNQGIDYALSVTGEESLYYGGHSMGCTQYLIMLSAKPEYNEKVCTGCPQKVPNRITCTQELFWVTVSHTRYTE